MDFHRDCGHGAAAARLSARRPPHGTMHAPACGPIAAGTSPMSESRTERRAGRAERGTTAAAAAPAFPTFSVVASGENVVLVNTTNGQSWVMTADGGRPVWHPVAFEAGATRAPRRAEPRKDDSAE
jgi:hypothetical protein